MKKIREILGFRQKGMRTTESVLFPLDAKNIEAKIDALCSLIRQWVNELHRSDDQLLNALFNKNDQYFLLMQDVKEVLEKLENRLSILETEIIKIQLRSAKKE